MRGLENITVLLCRNLKQSLLYTHSNDDRVRHIMRGGFWIRFFNFRRASNSSGQG